jgi:predicted XRE-type DNA-binding protein
VKTGNLTSNVRIPGYCAALIAIRSTVLDESRHPEMHWKAAGYDDVPRGSGGFGIGPRIPRNYNNSLVEALQAADLKFRADMMLLLREYFRAQSATQADISRRFGVPQPRVSELLTGKIDKFSADKLIGFAAKLGIRFYPSVVKASRGKPMRVKCDVAMVAPPG